MAGQAKPDDSIREFLTKQGYFLQNGRWLTRKEIMVRARYGNDVQAVRRAINAVKAGWHKSGYHERGVR